MAFRTKPLDQIVWRDIAELAGSSLPEDAMLEFKGLLPEKNGKAHPWYSDRDQITDFTRDELAAEVVALANAYGGRLIIGIAETQDRPRKAAGIAALPRCEKFAEQFEQALRSIVDPPIGGLQIKAVPNPEEDGAGAIVVAVSASDLAPHGVGRPPSAYVRRGTACEPMTMRDLQSSFWEARTKRERIDRIRAACHSEFANAYEDPSLLLPAPQTTSFPDEGLYVRITAIAQQPLGLSSEALINIVSESRLTRHAFEDGWWMPFGGGQPSHGWRPRAHGCQGFDEGPSFWTVLDDGTINVVGLSPPLQHPILKNAHFPGCFVLQATQILVMSDWLRRETGRPDIPIELDLEFLHTGTAVGIEGGRVHGSFAGRINRNVEIGPFLFSQRADAERVCRELEQQIWNGMGFKVAEQANLQFPRWFNRKS